MKLYRVRLTAEERAQLGELLSKGKAAARTLTHARILLKADEGLDGPRLTDEDIAEALDVNRSTVERVRIRCVEEGFEAALRPRPSRQLHPRKLDGVQEAHLVTLAAVRRRKGVGAGRCVCLPTSLWNWRSWTTFRTRPCGRRLKKPTEALAETTVLPAGSAERRVRLSHGGRTRRLHASLRSASATSLSG